MQAGDQHVFDVGFKSGRIGGPSMIMEAPIPSEDKAAIRVVFFPRLRGTLSVARCPLGERGQGNIGAAFIQKDQPVRVQLTHLLMPVVSFLLVALTGTQ